LQGAGHVPPAFLTPRAAAPNGSDDGLVFALTDIPGPVQIPAIAAAGPGPGGYRSLL
jgi:hypothetical protein